MQLWEGALRRRELPFKYLHPFLTTSLAHLPQTERASHLPPHEPAPPGPDELPLFFIIIIIFTELKNVFKTTFNEPKMLI